MNRHGTQLMGRLHATIGSVRAPFTCPDEALQDPGSECYQGTRSDDSYKPNIWGAELAVGWPLAGGHFRPYLGGGFNLLRPRFQVNFRNVAGTLDRRKVEVNLTRVVFFGGATWAPSNEFSLSGEIYSAPQDAVTGRVRLSYAIRR